jgi:hypothetical protein
LIDYLSLFISSSSRFYFSDVVISFSAPASFA